MQMQVSKKSLLRWHEAAREVCADCAAAKGGNAHEGGAKILDQIVSIDCGLVSRGAVPSRG